MNFHIQSQDYYDPPQDYDYWQHDDSSKKHHHVPRSSHHHLSYPYLPSLPQTNHVFELDDDWTRYPHIKQEDLYTDVHLSPAPYQSQSQPQPQPQSHYQPLLSPLHTQPTSFYSPTYHNQLHPRPTFQALSFAGGGGTIHPSELSPITDSAPTSVSPTLSTFTAADLSTVVLQQHDSHYVCQPHPNTISLKSWDDDRRSSIDSQHQHQQHQQHQQHSHSHHHHSSSTSSSMNGIDIGIQSLDGMDLGHMAGVVVGGLPIVDIAPGVVEGTSSEDAVGEVDAEGDDDWEHVQDSGIQHVVQLHHHHHHQNHFQPTHHAMEYISGSDDASFTEEEPVHSSSVSADAEHPIDAQNLSQTHLQQQQQQQQQQHDNDEEGEDEVPVMEEDLDLDSDDSAAEEGGEGGGTSEIKQEYDSDFSDSSEESEDDDEEDPHDPEFVPRSRRRPTGSASASASLRRRATSTYATAVGDAFTTASQYVSTIPFSNISGGVGGGEGRNLRPRASSARYTPYPSTNSGSYPESSSSSAGYYANANAQEYDSNSGYSEQQQQQQQQQQRANGRRHNSTSSSSTHGHGYHHHPPRSASSVSSSVSSSNSNSGSGSGSTSTAHTTPSTTTTATTTTTQTTTRRRLRPSNTLPVPIPVPNLTKKSRGRRVPTMSSLEDVRSAASGAGRKQRQAAVSGGGGGGGGGKGTARMYLCDVDGCGKCFARGEHLKRHVRSIHTYEKPHKCLYPGCGKDFSRHDNLGQHMRVHKDYVQEGVTIPGSGGVNGVGKRRG